MAKAKLPLYVMSAAPTTQNGKDNASLRCVELPI